MVTTSNLGFPRIGEKRELKKALEAYWKQELSAEDLQRLASDLRKKNWQIQKDAGIDLIPSNDFSFYDQMLDMSCLLGAVPSRFTKTSENSRSDLDIMFLIARGMAKENTTGTEGEGTSDHASEMTKWFDTNYHYIVPELGPDTKFTLTGNKPIKEFLEAKSLGITTKPVLIGPLTYLLLSKPSQSVSKDEAKNFDPCSMLDQILPIYGALLQALRKEGAEWVQLDEPALVLDLTAPQRALYEKAYTFLAQQAPGLKLLVATYFGVLGDNLSLLVNLPVQGVHLDAVRGKNEIAKAVAAFPKDKTLSLGVVDGRNIWRNNPDSSLEILRAALTKVGSERLMVAPSCSLIHTPVTLRNERKLDQEFKEWLAFAEEKLKEVADLAGVLNKSLPETALDTARKAVATRRTSTRIHHDAVKARCAAVTEGDYERKSAFPIRQQAQRKRFALPLFPTTTIGSFPQTQEVRLNRAKLKRGDLSQEQYDSFIAKEIESSVRFQEEADIDMLVHGEFERNDMVEYFGEQLSGYEFTQNGWVQSYGSRYVKPPVVFGDVSRPEPMTVRWSKYAKELTTRPMKGMLSGPITMLQWSFVRDDIPRSEVAKQIALALRDEVSDLEAAGIGAIQIDEPALREGLPLRRSDWAAYLDWAVKAFKLSGSSVRDETQIHTHMCYAEFNDIIGAVADLDADVISIETSRSNMELLEAFTEFKYPNEVGPGVYDIHSPRVPTVDEMVGLIEKARAVLPVQNLWVNPDCGLKTRQWKEVHPALRNMAEAARQLRTRESETLKVSNG